MIDRVHTEVRCVLLRAENGVDLVSDSRDYMWSLCETNISAAKLKLHVVKRNNIFQTKSVAERRTYNTFALVVLYGSTSSRSSSLPRGQGFSLSFEQVIRGGYRIEGESWAARQ